jgi:hypothetical protein
MEISINIKDRKPIWIALSAFYLDTEVREADLRSIAGRIRESPYTLQEVQKINKYEVFPVLRSNLSAVVGEWSGFDEEWLINSIIASLEGRTILGKLATEGEYLIHKRTFREYWNLLEPMCR